MSQPSASRGMLVAFLAGVQALLLGCGAYVLADGDHLVRRDREFAPVKTSAALIAPQPLVEATSTPALSDDRTPERTSRQRKQTYRVYQQRTAERPDPRRARLTWPVRGAITSPYGPRGDGFHHGVDIGCATGWAIQAARAGTVVAYGDGGFYGNAVVLQHADGFMTLYAHLDGFAVEHGQRVKRHQVIGTCGSTGRSTGSHLHFEVRYGGYVWDPLTFLP